MLSLLRLTRPGNALIAAGSVWVSAWYAGGLSHFTFLAVGVAMALLAAAGNVHNDLMDIATDRINQPGRPLAAGLVSPSQAWRLTIMLTLTALGLGFWLDHHHHGTQIPWSLVFGGIAALLLLYNTRLKGLPLIGNLVVASLCATPLLTPLNDAPRTTTTSFFLAFFAFWTTLIREIAKDLEDIPGDRAQNLRTLPILIGERPARALIRSMILLMTALLALPAFLGSFPWLFSLASLPLVALPLMRAFKAHSIRDTQKALKWAMLGGLLAVILTVSPRS